MKYHINPIHLLILIIILLPSVSEPGQDTAKKKVKLASAEYEPYIGENLPNHGYVHELVTEAFKRAGYEAEIKFFPLVRAKYFAKIGDLDGLVPAYDQESLKENFIFSLPFPGNNIGLLKKKSLKIDYRTDPRENPVKALQGLQKYEFGIVRGTDATPVIDDARFLSKHFVAKDIQNIDKLAAGRVDFVVIDKYVAADLMVLKRPHLIGGLEFMNPPLATNDFHVAFSKNSPGYEQRQKDFNIGLEAVMKDGTLNKILSSHGLNQFKARKEQKIKLTIGTVDNPEMVVMQGLSKQFEKTHPNIELEWKVLKENTLRRRLMSDFAISEGQFDIMMIGTYEAPVWAKKGWLVQIKDLPAKYDLNDILKPIRSALSFQGNLYALPFYGESSFTFYRKDLFKKAGITMPAHPNYDEIMKFAALIHDPKNKVYGIGLRGKPGWGQNMSFISTLINTFGGRWFDENWNPTIDTPEWKKAISYYVKILKNYGHPNIAGNGWQANRDLFADGQLGIMIDATVLAGKISNPRFSKVHDKVGFVFAPTAVTPKGSFWLWAWALAIPTSSKHPEEALEFITWATSKEYIKTIVERDGWISVPPGTRISTYKKEYMAVAPFADLTLKTIRAANTIDFTLKPVPYTGNMYISIPEYPAIGRQVGIEINKVLQGIISIDQALENSQKLVTRQMRNSGYIK